LTLLKFPNYLFVSVKQRYEAAHVKKMFCLWQGNHGWKFHQPLAPQGASALASQYTQNQDPRREWHSQYKGYMYALSPLRQGTKSALDGTAYLALVF
jgi:hypothetical protein